MENKAEICTVPKEEEELSQFFEKLADLVPKFQCPCEQSSDPNCFIKHTSEADNLIIEQNSDKLQSRKLKSESMNSISHGCSFSRSVANEIPNKINNTNIMLIERSGGNYCSEEQNTTTVVNNIPHPNKLSNCYMCPRRHQSYFSKYTKQSSHVMKPCKIRNRPAPYKINKQGGRHSHQTSEVNHHDRHQQQIQSRSPTSQDSKMYHKHYNNCNPPNSSEPETEERLELLTDVIEYIHNLKSILENAQSRSYGSDLELCSTRLGLDGGDRDVHVEQTNITTADGSSSHRVMADGMQPVEQSIKLLDHRAVQTTGSTTYRIMDTVPTVDRAMELLEYKTGAITLTA